jgi:hypothetical protein
MTDLKDDASFSRVLRYLSDIPDQEPTGRAENVAYSDEEQDYPHGPESAPTLILEGRTTPLVVIVAALGLIVTGLAAVSISVFMTRSTPMPSVVTTTKTTPPTTTHTTTVTSTVAPPPTVTVTTQAPVSKIGMSCSVYGRDNTDALITDPATGQTLVCGGDVWTVADTLIGIRESGSSCTAAQKGMHARTPEGYQVSCWNPADPSKYMWISSNY